MKEYVLEKITKEEKETFIYIDKLDKTCRLYTTDAIIFKKLLRILGEPTEVLPASYSRNDVKLVSGGTWTYNYNSMEDRQKIKKMLSLTTLLPRRKN